MVLGVSRMRAVLLLSSLSLWPYEDSWLKVCAQSLLRFLGFIFWGAAAALAFGGVVVILMYKNYGDLFQECLFSLPGWLAVAAALNLLPTGILTILISAKRSRYYQGALVYLLLVLFCLEMSSAVLVRFYSVRVASEMKSTMGYLVYQYSGTYSQGHDSPVDELQRKLQCCGVQNYTDWLQATVASWHLQAEKPHVPESCCEVKYSHCRGDLGHLERIFQEGCLQKLEDWLHFVMFYMFSCCTVLSVLELLAGVSNDILMRHQSFHDHAILE
ncbi:tetraspanin-3 [Columba livia]|uniref:Tetraspanin n=1 Tax=Columba livia TaxID=8932 RepID=A0A2I0M5F1_COLLI|nr:tetraspanin-3 [Columba livia]PKK24900.1 tetraspanin-3 [Columba livia]